MGRKLPAVPAFRDDIVANTKKALFATKLEPIPPGFPTVRFYFEIQPFGV
jgi:hypothetical protein